MEILRTWRTEKGLTTAEAGALIGISGVQWHRYETGARNVAPAKASEIERITGIPREELRPDIFGPAKAEHAA